jgi:glycosyltransferase involved in cell wall biosynthesis
MERQIRVAHLISHPIQYFVPLYRSLEQRAELDFTVYFYSGQSLREHFDAGFGRKLNWDISLIGGYKHHLSATAEKRAVARGFDWRPNWPILRELVRQRYDVIWIHGCMFVTAWLAVALGRMRKFPVLLRDDHTLLPARSFTKRLAKDVILPVFYGNVSGLYVGKKNRDSLEYYGTAKLFPAYYCVDNEQLRKRFNELKPERQQIRRDLGVQGSEPVILFCGKLIDKKQPQLLLEAFRRLRGELRCHLLFVGEGNLRPALEQRVREQGILDVHFAGFKNQTELPATYAAADLLVLPSSYGETWGLVVNEAMNFDLPIVVSDRVGCAGDIVKAGENGYVFPSGDVDQLVAALRRLVESETLRRQFGQKSGEIVADYSIEACTQQIVEACRSVRRYQAQHYASEGEPVTSRAR